MIIILFGLSASGKTYVGNVIQEEFGFHHEDADQWLTEEMKQYVVDRKLFTLEMLDEFSTNIVNNIEDLSKKHKTLVVSQALYRQKNREMIRESLAYKLPDKNILFIQVDAEKKTIYKRLNFRGDWVSPEYAKTMEPFFEPMESAIVLKNNSEGNEEIIKQMKNIYMIAKKSNLM